jgi:D-sedoheptulose 7-phosphate isomerase
MDAATTSRMSQDFFSNYSERLQAVLRSTDWAAVGVLAEELLGCWRTGRQVFICGNGGSAANAMHLANDLLYGISKKAGSGLRVQALSANTAVMSCLGNDEGYEKIFSLQLAVLAQKGDVLIVLSGSGNSPNIIQAIEQAKLLEMRTYGILGYSGGIAKDLLEIPIHFEVNDMQISEDLQLVAGHMIAQWLYAHR